VALKACKNDKEIEGMKNCHKRDGAAVVEFFAALFEDVNNGKSISEVEIDERITASRKLISSKDGFVPSLLYTYMCICFYTQNNHIY
jgi:Xaa-Pro aminopeptidase